MKIVICDDDPVVLSVLNQCALEFFSNRGLNRPELFQFSCGEDALESGISADIAFLDVEMPGRSGIHVGAELMKRNPYVKVFIVTSFPDYLDEAMEFHVYRYLSKPIDKNRLFRNLQAAIKQLETETKRINVLTEEGGTLVQADSILCVERVSGKVFVIQGNQTLDTTMKFEELAEILLQLPSFFQSHRSFIVNLKYVSEYRRDCILLKAGEKTVNAYLTKRKLKEFRHSYSLYLECFR